MPPSQGIPTSFIPQKQNFGSSNRQTVVGTNLFLITALVIFGVVIILSGGLFMYTRYLQHSAEEKSIELKSKESGVNKDIADGFIRLRDRLETGKELVQNHILLSQFFTTLESITLSNIRFSSLKLTVAGDKSARVELTGSARNFNALAAQSNTLAGDKRFKRAIFSGIKIAPDRSVDFSLTTDIEPKMILFGSDTLLRTSEVTAIPAVYAQTIQNNTPKQNISTSTKNLNIKAEQVPLINTPEVTVSSKVATTTSIPTPAISPAKAIPSSNTKKL
jgi:hypothetical protein